MKRRESRREHSSFYIISLFSSVLFSNAHVTFQKYVHCVHTYKILRRTYDLQKIYLQDVNALEDVRTEGRVCPEVQDAISVCECDIEGKKVKRQLSVVFRGTIVNSP
jgi:hypothetical protein